MVFPAEAPPWGLLSWPKPPLAWDSRGLAMLKCEPDVSLFLAGPPVPPVLAHFSLRQWTGCRAAPHARARGELLGGVSDASVVRQEQPPRPIGVGGLVDVVQQAPDIFVLDRGLAPGLVAADGAGVCDLPV